MSDQRAVTAAAELSPASISAVTAKITGHRVLRVERVTGSVGNHDFAISTTGGDLILKASQVQDLVPEAWACQRVRQEGILAPEVLHLEPEAQSLPMPFLVMHRLPGEPVEAGSAALAAVGRALARVHSLRLDGFGALAVEGDQARGRYDSWAAHVADLTSGLEDLVAGRVLDRVTANQVAVTLERSGAEIRFDGPAVLLHGDLKLAHLFATSDREVGVIDWGDVCAGDPRLDLARLSMVGPTTLAAVLSGYGRPLTPELSRTLACYRMVWSVDALAYEFHAGGDWFGAYRAQIQAAIGELA